MKKSRKNKVYPPLIQRIDKDKALILQYPRFDLKASCLASDSFLIQIMADYEYCESDDSELILMRAIESTTIEHNPEETAKDLYDKFINILEEYLPGYDNIATNFGIKIVLKSFVDILLDMHYTKGVVTDDDVDIQVKEEKEED